MNLGNPSQGPMQDVSCTPKRHYRTDPHPPLLVSNRHTSANRKKGGRPLGSTNKKKRKRIENINNAKNEIVKNFIQLTEHDDLTSISKKGLFKYLVKEQKMNGNLPPNYYVSYNTIRLQICRNNPGGNGNKSPMRKIEKQIVEIILCMSKIKRSITPFEGLALINDMIKGTDIQRELIDWKLRHNIYFERFEDLGTVGLGYWRVFMQRNGQVLCSKVSRKFSKDRSSWTTYLLFNEMYDHIQQIMIECGISEQLQSPVWMDEHGHEVDDKNKAFGMKVEAKLVRPDLGFMCNEVGCNL